MWRFVIATMATAMALSPSLASATVYTFQDTETSALSSSPVSFSFTLDTATAAASGSGITLATLFNGVSIEENGIPTSGSVDATFTTDLSSPLFFWVDTSLEPFYAGSGTGIAFNTGTFAIADGLTDGEGTLTISASPVAPTPEPAPWLLLLTGAAGAVTASRLSRRSRAIRHTAVLLD